MMVYKTKEDIELLRKSNLLVSKTLAEVASLIKPGVTTIKLDKKAEEFIRDNSAKPAFLGYNEFPNTLCTSVNNQVVHGIPSSYELKDGDILSIDCGVLLNEFYGDSAYTFPVGEVEERIMGLLIKTKESLFKGIEHAVEGKRLGDISYAIQSYVEDSGYSVVREMVGHGLGRKLHEEPEVPNYGKRGTGIKLKKGLVICVEPMINLGTQKIKQENDGWTIVTVDGKPSAHYELAIVVNKDTVDILSTFEYIEKVFNNLPDSRSLLASVPCR